MRAAFGSPLNRGEVAIEPVAPQRTRSADGQQALMYRGRLRVVRRVSVCRWRLENRVGKDEL